MSFVGHPTSFAFRIALLVEVYPLLSNLADALSETPLQFNRIGEANSSSRVVNEPALAPPLELTTPHILTPADSDGSDTQISELDSDLEVEELTSTYLKIKARLYEIDPQLVEASSRKPARKTISKVTRPMSCYPPNVTKLLQQLQQLASDALFDDLEAETQWPAKRTQIAQRQAVVREQHRATSQAQGESPTVLRDESIEATPPLLATESIVGSDDGMDMLGDMFSAIPESSAVQQRTTEDSADDIVLRDFGKTSGVSPRKVLEELVHSK